MAEVVRRRLGNDAYCQTVGSRPRSLEAGSADDRRHQRGTHQLPPHSRGGAIDSLADAVFAAASNSYGKTAVALETTMSSLEAVEVGTELTATATETHESGRPRRARPSSPTGRRANHVFRGRVYER